MVEEWQKREHFIGDEELMRYPNVKQYILGRKNGRPHVQVFLGKDDETAKSFFQEKGKLLSNKKDTHVEFTIIKENSREMWDEAQRIQQIEKNAPAIPESIRNEIKGIINSDGEKIYSTYSNVVSIGISNVLTGNGETEERPCIVLYCLDKGIIPFGENPLPKRLRGYPCDIREEIIIFGACENCRNVNPGCDIRSNRLSGSAGFLVHFRKLDARGFLTAAHVAVENVGLLYKHNSENYLNTDHSGDIMHLNNSCDKVGEVKKCFFGNFRSCGSDVAIVCMLSPKDMLEGKWKSVSNVIYDCSLIYPDSSKY